MMPVSPAACVNDRHDRNSETANFPSLMPSLKFSLLFHLIRHPRFHKEILKHFRWTKMDAVRKQFYSGLIGPRDLVFDVGANVGNRSKIFRELGAVVVAFEPQAYCAEFLSFAFANDDQFTVVKKALSDTEGQFELHIGEAHTLSTLDTSWLAKMESGGRFTHHKWQRTEIVNVTTLDNAIESFGVPAFIKIDVEGHEYRVVRGLTRPVNLLSMEFASESIDNINQCIDHLTDLADYEFRLSLGESMVFEGSDWVSAPEIKIQLEQAKVVDPLAWGDVYAKRVQSSPTSRA